VGVFFNFTLEAISPMGCVVIFCINAVFRIVSSLYCDLCSFMYCILCRVRMRGGSLTHWLGS